MVSGIGWWHGGVVMSEAPVGDVDGFGAIAIVSTMRRWGIVCVSALALVACSGGDDDASSITTAVPVGTPAVSVDTSLPDTTSAPTDPPATTSASTTELPATTEAAPPTTEMPATTAAPDTTESATTDTTDPSVDEEVGLRIAAVEQPKIARAAAVRVFEDPFNDDLLADLENFYTGRLLEGLTNIVQQLRDGNYRAVQRDGQPEVYEPDPRSLTADLSAGRATVQVCHVQTLLTVETGGNPDGSDLVVLDEIVEEIVELELELIAGNWLVSSASAPETEIATCP